MRRSFGSAIAVLCAVFGCTHGVPVAPHDAGMGADSVDKSDTHAAEAGLAETVAQGEVAVATEIFSADAADAVADAPSDATQIDGDILALDSALDTAADTNFAPEVDTTPDLVADIDPLPDASAGEVVAPDIQLVTDATAEAKVYDVDPNLDVGFLAAPDAVPVAVSATNVDVVGVAYTCDGKWQPKLCGAPISLDPPQQPGKHVDLPTPITYADSPPSSGTHRPQWGNWGEYVYMPQQRWLHNLEHGGIALLYHPCAPKTTVEALRALAKAIPPDESGPPRWVLTPYPNLPTAVAMVRWGHVWLGECVAPSKMVVWLLEKAGDSPEVVAMPGGYDQLWLGGWP